MFEFFLFTIGNTKSQAGQCQITLEGPRGSILALLVSNIQFHDGHENLKVITKARSVPYTMKT